jgi:hypothetical protein
MDAEAAVRSAESDRDAAERDDATVMVCVEMEVAVKALVVNAVDKSTLLTLSEVALSDAMEAEAAVSEPERVTEAADTLAVVTDWLVVRLVACMAPVMSSEPPAMALDTVSVTAVSVSDTVALVALTVPRVDE